MIGARNEQAALSVQLLAGGATWPQVVAALHARWRLNARQVIRVALGLSQRQVADIWCDRWPGDQKTFKNISTWECWPASGHEPSLLVLDRLAQIYECSVADLVSDFPDHGAVDAGHGAHGASGHAEAVDRRGVLKLGLKTSAAAVLYRARDYPPGRPVIGGDHIDALTATLRHIEEHDATSGAGSIYDEVVALHRRVEAWLHDGAHADRHVSDELRAHLGELCAWAGWLAIDAGRPLDAGRHLRESLVHARLLDDPALEVRALTYMCLVHKRRPREALACAEVAQGLARGWQTPRLGALLHLRAARAHAALGATSGFNREMAKAKAQLDRGAHDDDPLYVRFVTPQELAGIEGLSYLALDRPARAVKAFASVVDTPDPARPRNVGYYTVQLAQAHAESGNPAVAAEVGLKALDALPRLSSGRTTRLLDKLRASIEPHAAIPAARDFLDACAEARA